MDHFYPGGPVARSALAPIDRFTREGQAQIRIDYKHHRRHITYLLTVISRTNVFHLG